VSHLTLVDINHRIFGEVIATNNTIDRTTFYFA